MEAYFEEALQQPIRATDKVPECVEADDRHVVATALSAGSELLVTLNLSDIPPQCLIETVALKVESPDEFLCGLLDESDFRLQQTLVEQAEALENPPLTPLDILDLLSRLTPEFANRARILFTESAFG